MACTWAQFIEKVKGQMSDASRDNTTGVLAIAEFVKSHIVRQVDKNLPLSAAHEQQWLLFKDRLLGQPIYLAKDMLRAEVDKFLTVDAKRQGIQDYIDALIAVALSEINGSSPFIDNYIAQGMVDLQHFIPYYRTNQEKVFQSTDATENGLASDLTLPEGAMIQDVYYVMNDADCVRMPVSQYDWQNRYDLVCGSPRLNCQEFFAAISPNGNKMTVYPSLAEGFHVSCFYDGLKGSWQPGDTVPCDATLIQAMADYVRARMYVMPPLANPKMAAIHFEAYKSKRLQAFINARDYTRIRNTNDSPDPEVNKCCCSCCCPPPPDDGGGENGGGGGDMACDICIITVPTVAQMLDLKSIPERKLVFVMDPELALSKTYKFLWGDTRPANPPMIMAAKDGKGNYVEYNLA